MNLFYDPSIIGLRKLVDTADKSLTIHNIVVDFDGEVIIDPEKKYAGINLKRFKYCTQITQAVGDDLKALLALFEDLRAAYNGKSRHINLNRKLKDAA